MHIDTNIQIRILRMGPVELLDLYPFRLLATIVLFMLASISIAIYVLVRGLEQRLRKMEEAATQISQGNSLDTRFVAMPAVGAPARSPEAQASSPDTGTGDCLSLPTPVDALKPGTIATNFGSAWHCLRPTARSGL
jgi:hypothetical protein